MATAADGYPPAGEGAPVAEMSEGAEGLPCLHYFQYSGRGELTRLIAAVGGVEITESAEEVGDHSSFGSPGTVPVLTHGDLKISQSFAIETYISSIAPVYAGLDVAQRAMDCMFCKIKEDVLQGFRDVLDAMETDESKKGTAFEDVAAVGDKWFPIIEGRLSGKGFVNALEFPTAADLALLNMAKATMPFQAVYSIGCYDLLGKYPKFATHVRKVEKDPAVQRYLQRSATFLADPFGLIRTDENPLILPADPQAAAISKFATEVAELWHAVDGPVPDCAVIWIHGLGETEVFWQEVFEEANLIEMPELGEIRWVMPRAEMGPCTTRGGAITFQWFDTPEYPVCLIVPGAPDHVRKDEDPEQVKLAVHRIHEAVLALEVEGVPCDKIIIAGFGQGGALAVHAATSYPKTLAGTAMLSGYVPCRPSLRSCSTTDGLKTELLWLHGIHDAVVATDAATSQAKELSDELGVPLDFRLSFDYGHETTDEELAAFRCWLVKKLSPPVEAEPEEVAEPEVEIHVHHVHDPGHRISSKPQDPWGPPQRSGSLQGAH